MQPSSRSVRTRQHREVLAGFNLIEADSIEAAVRIAHDWPWIRFGSIEVRPVRDFDAVRRRVGA